MNKHIKLLEILDKLNAIGKAYHICQNSFCAHWTPIPPRYGNLITALNDTTEDEFNPEFISLSMSKKKAKLRRQAPTGALLGTSRQARQQSQCHETF